MPPATNTIERRKQARLARKMLRRYLHMMNGSEPDEKRAWSALLDAEKAISTIKAYTHLSES